MARSIIWSVGLGALLIGGCVTPDGFVTLVSENPFGANPAPAQVSKASLAPASLEVAARVDSVGRKIAVANEAQTGLRPLFRTIGMPQPEIFHIGTSEIDVTEGFAKECKTDAALAAALCAELGKMVAEREATAGPQLRAPSTRLPMGPPVGNDSGGLFGSADQIRQAELAKIDKQHHAPKAPPLDPAALAKSYLVKAGFADTEYDAIQPLLKTASENNAFGKQMIPVAQ